MKGWARGLVATALAAATATCATGGKLRADGDVIRADVEKARKSGAERCAPKELALAEANVDFGLNEIEQGDAVRAQEHMTIAEENVKKALVMSKDCGPKTVTIKDKVVVKIEKVDTDGDGVTDDVDRCPEQPGKPELLGCPDKDGDGVPDIDDKCPEQAGPKENQGCPVTKDTDGDGIPDDIDRCPNDPEDKDGFQDDDGCPDPDNDNDGIVDKMDRCPNEPGPIENHGCPVTDRDGDGIPDQDDKCPTEPGVPPDGCPKKYTLVEVKKDRIEIKQQIHFASGKFKILPDSFGLMDQVTQVLKDYPKMKVRIEGHTDNVGGESFNLKLSQKRADAVMEYVASHGVDPARLEAAGMGLTKPIASNKTAKGKAQNRRTEFHIISME